jgi:hypothetical protein
MVVEKQRADVCRDVCRKSELEDLAWCWVNLELQSGALGLALAMRLRVDALAKLREAMKLMAGDCERGEKRLYCNENNCRLQLSMAAGRKWD